MNVLLKVEFACLDPFASQVLQLQLIRDLHLHFQLASRPVVGQIEPAQSNYLSHNPCLALEQRSIFTSNMRMISPHHPTPTIGSCAKALRYLTHDMPVCFAAWPLIQDEIMAVIYLFSCSTRNGGKLAKRICLSARVFLFRAALK